MTGIWEKSLLTLMVLHNIDVMSLLAWEMRVLLWDDDDTESISFCDESLVKWDFTQHNCNCGFAVLFPSLLLYFVAVSASASYSCITSLFTCWFSFRLFLVYSIFVSLVLRVTWWESVPRQSHHPSLKLESSSQSLSLVLFLLFSDLSSFESFSCILSKEKKERKRLYSLFSVSRFCAEKTLFCASLFYSVTSISSLRVGLLCTPVPFKAWQLRDNWKTTATSRIVVLPVHFAKWTLHSREKLCCFTCCLSVWEYNRMPLYGWWPVFLLHLLPCWSPCHPTSNRYSCERHTNTVREFASFERSLSL